MTAHTIISYIKSAVRILGYIALIWVAPYLWQAGILLIGAELIGVLEELPWTYKGTETK
jgi:hypothetical protein